ncbi:ArgE/DapE family deacylase [Comamonas aquatica]|uniref:ArgE/DapE family deacylase n=1 Tax=Comamonas aquatica TaxID=225991 RepID=UPI0028D328A8|nr:ArgE/DapE family deacylase [Comamonas aquatica]
MHTTTPSTSHTLSTNTIATAVTAQRSYLLDTLSQLVAAPSPSGNETPACTTMEGLLQELGLTTERIPMDTDALSGHPLFSCPCSPDGNRFNLLAEINPPGDATPTGLNVLFNGHLDVVPTGPEHLWAKDPYQPYEQDGWLYGRGAGDMKGGIACVLAAIRTLQSLGLQPTSRIGINTVVDEEDTGNGTLTSLGVLQRARSKARYSGYDAVIIPEPFGETLMAAQIGVCWLTVTLTGRPAHVAYMNQGLNPIDAGIQIMQALKQVQDEWNLPENRHPAFAHVSHPININLGTIEGGEWKSSVPCTCTMGIRASFYPGRDAQEAISWFSRFITDTARRLNPDLEAKISNNGFAAPGCVYDLQHPAMQALSQSHAALHGAPPTHLACTATTDGRHFRLATDWAVTNYGPTARNIHGIDECVSIDSMLRVTQTLVHYIVTQCGVVPIASSNVT